MTLPQLPRPIHDFESASQAVLYHLRERLRFDLWMVTRAEGDDWIVLNAEDHGYGVKAQEVFVWAEFFCCRMIEGLGPRIAPRADAIPAYVSARIGQRVKIGAYVGVPLRKADGSLFGTLCAIHPEAQPEAITGELPLIELLAGLLSHVLNCELAAMGAARRAERTETGDEVDTLTGLSNREGWRRLVEAEEERCRRLGASGCVITVEVRTETCKSDAAVDELVGTAGKAIRAAAREIDLTARVGGDRFAVLATEADFATAQELLQRIMLALKTAGVSASLGLARRIPGQGLERAWWEAEREEKYNVL